MSAYRRGGQELSKETNKEKTAQEYRQEARTQIAEYKDSWKTFLKTGVFVVSALVILIVLCLAWFVMNHRVDGTTGEISAKSLPYALATKVAKDGTEDSWLDRIGVGRGREETFDGERYLISDGGSIKLQVSDDNNMKNKDADNRGIAPGDSGKVTFYVIPREEGYKKFSFQTNLVPYTTSSGMDTEETVQADLQKVTDPDVSNLLKGHVLFFKNYSETEGYSGWIQDGKLEVSSETAYPVDKPIEVSVYWVWPRYFQSFMKTGGLFEKQELISRFEQAMKAEGTREYFFKGYEESKLGETADWNFDSLDATQFMQLTNWYNSGDYTIGSGTDYLYFEFECR